MCADAMVSVKPLTEEELLRLSAGDTWYEVVEGELVAVAAAGFLHALIVGNIYLELAPFVRQHGLGYFLPDGMHCILSADAEGLKGSRIPDLAFIRKARIAPDFDFNRPFPGAPDLVIEVVSPTEGEDETLAKVRDFLAAGSEQAWVVYPRTQEVHRYRRDEPSLIRVVRAGETLAAEALFPGWSVEVGRLFAVE